MSMEQTKALVRRNPGEIVDSNGSTIAHEELPKYVKRLQDMLTTVQIMQGQLNTGQTRDAALSEDAIAKLEALATIYSQGEQAIASFLITHGFDNAPAPEVGFLGRLFGAKKLVEEIINDAQKYGVALRLKAVGEAQSAGIETRAAIDAELTAYRTEMGVKMDALKGSLNDLEAKIVERKAELFSPDLEINALKERLAHLLPKTGEEVIDKFIGIEEDIFFRVGASISDKVDGYFPTRADYRRWINAFYNPDDNVEVFPLANPKPRGVYGIFLDENLQGDLVARLRSWELEFDRLHSSIVDYAVGRQTIDGTTVADDALFKEALTSAISSSELCDLLRRMKDGKIKVLSALSEKFTEGDVQNDTEIKEAIWTFNQALEKLPEPLREGLRAQFNLQYPLAPSTIDVKNLDRSLTSTLTTEDAYFDLNRYGIVRKQVIYTNGNVACEPWTLFRVTKAGESKPEVAFMKNLDGSSTVKTAVFGEKGINYYEPLMLKPIFDSNGTEITGQIQPSAVKDYLDAQQEMISKLSVRANDKSSQVRHFHPNIQAQMEFTKLFYDKLIEHFSSFYQQKRD